MRTNEKRYERERNVVSRRKMPGKKMQRRAFLLSAFCLLLLFSCSYVFTSRAQNSNETVKYYRSIEVAPGDTLWDIAGDYTSVEYKDRYAYIDEVKKLNHLTSDQISAGEFLTVPYYDVP